MHKTTRSNITKIREKIIYSNNKTDHPGSHNQVNVGSPNQHNFACQENYNSPSLQNFILPNLENRVISSKNTHPKWNRHYPASTRE
jgi:hypothetical protein